MHYCIWRLLEQYFVLELLSSEIEIKCVTKRRIWQDCEYAGLYSIRSLYKLLSSYLDREEFRTLSNIKIESFAINNV